MLAGVAASREDHRRPLNRCDAVREFTGAPRNDITSKPAVVQGRVYSASADRYLYVYDAAGCAGQAFCAPLWRGQLDLFAFATAGCGRVTCEALRLVVPSREQNYSGAPLAVAGDRIAFVSNDNTDEHSNVAIMGLP